MPTNFESLFDNSSANQKYISINDELVAVSKGAKGMSVFLFPDTSISVDPTFNEICLLARQLGLEVIIKSKLELVPEANFQMSYLFVVGKEEIWRVPAYLAVKKVFEHYGWCDGAEYLESEILGYSEKDILDWLRAHRGSRVGWTGKTFYLLLSPEQADHVRTLARRSIDPAVIARPIEVFFNRKRNPVRKDADSIFSEGYEIARVSVREPFFKELFGHQTSSSDSDIIMSLLTPKNVTKMNSALESNFEFLEDGNWT